MSRSDFKDFLSIIGMFFIVLIIFMGALGLIVGVLHTVDSLFEKLKCDTLSQVSEYSYHWDFWNGCLIKTPSGLWVDVDKVEYLLGEFEINVP